MRPEELIIDHFFKLLFFFYLFCMFVLEKYMGDALKLCTKIQPFARDHSKHPLALNLQTIFSLLLSQRRC